MTQACELITATAPNSCPQELFAAAPNICVLQVHHRYRFMCVPALLERSNLFYQAPIVLDGRNQGMVNTSLRPATSLSSHYAPPLLPQISCAVLAKEEGHIGSTSSQSSYMKLCMAVCFKCFLSLIWGLVCRLHQSWEEGSQNAHENVREEATQEECTKYIWACAGMRCHNNILS